LARLSIAGGIQVLRRASYSPAWWQQVLQRKSASLRLHSTKTKVMVVLDCWLAKLRLARSHQVAWPSERKAVVEPWYDAIPPLLVLPLMAPEVATVAVATQAQSSAKARNRTVAAVPPLYL
jgi:hypothetical protein